MPTVRLVASAYSTSSSSVTVSSPSNMYANTDSENYATLTSTSKDTSTRYVYIKGFNFGSIPSGAEVTAFAVKIRGYENRMSTSSSYAPRLVNGTSEISGTTASSNFTESAEIITIPTGSLTWAQITGYGSDFGVSVPLRRSNKNQQGYVYVYGVEIEVTYTDPLPPVITVGTPSRTIISNETGYDQSVCTFTSNLALSQWEVRATKAGITPALGVGLLVESGGSLAANTPATIYIDNEELTDGDGMYVITVYGRSTDGVWSNIDNYLYLQADTDEFFLTDEGQYLEVSGA